MNHPRIAPSVVLLACFAAAQLQAQTAQPGDTLLQAAEANRGAATLSAEILLTWRTGGVTRHTRGTIELEKPNLARIALHGDYPQALLVSDGHTRYLFSGKARYQASTMDAAGQRIDSPWWGLSFRYFFTQSPNPFGATADPAVVFRDILSTPDRQEGLRRITARGASIMGDYTETLAFDRGGTLVDSTVQFGQGPHAASFRAVLTHVRHEPIAAGTFLFKPSPGQMEVKPTDTMLPLGTRAPTFSLPDAEGKLFDFAQERQHKRAILVNFWFYDCAPCRREFPQFEALYEQFQAQGLSVIAIDKADPPNVVADYVRRAGLSFSVVLGGEASQDSVFSRYQVTDSFPRSYLLDSDGKVVYRSAGEDLDGLRRALAARGFRSIWSRPR